MVSGVIILLLMGYSVWAVHHANVERKDSKKQCSGCPYFDSGTYKDSPNGSNLAPIRRKES